MALKAKEIIRLYHMEDELMLTRAQTKHDLLEDDLGDFTPKFPEITEPWLISFQTDIATARNFQSDTEVVNTIKVLTEDVESSMDEGASALNAVDVYARLAFPTSPAKQRVFGQDGWVKARSDQQKMSKALKLAHSFANAEPYKTALLAKGLTQAQIDALLTIAENIDLKDALQEKAKAGRPVTTEERIKVLNIVWSKKQMLSLASELVYIDDAAKRAQYLLYPKASGASTTVIVHVTKGGVVQVGQVLLTNTGLAAQVIDASGNATFVSSNMPEAVDVQVVLSGGFEMELLNQPVIEGEENIIEALIPE